ncbi:MAG: hypothetical protein IPI35_33580 [Deltaproteobacteria bacterium]|nr:hypothetical protein [Deltaproteobacteria bacterium]
MAEEAPLWRLAQLGDAPVLLAAGLDELHQPAALRAWRPAGWRLPGPDAAARLDAARRYAQARDSAYVGVEHLCGRALSGAARATPGAPWLHLDRLPRRAQTGPERPASRPWAWIFPRALASKARAGAHRARSDPARKGWRPHWRCSAALRAADCSPCSPESGWAATSPALPRPSTLHRHADDRPPPAAAAPECGWGRGA